MPESSLFEQIKNLDTEKTNPRTVNIDILDTHEVLVLINAEDKTVPHAVAEQIPNITKAVDIIVDRMKKGGRLIYFGAGTSGRLGVVDSSECPPTFGVDKTLVQACIAGGLPAIFTAQEGAEDSEKLGENDFNDKNPTPNDIVCGIAASGRTPYVLGALKAARKLGAATMMLTTVSEKKTDHLKDFCDVIIAPYVGPEVIAGSTRMKSGTAQKLVLNMLTTASMIKLGKTYGNVMVDLQLTNQKLKERAKRIIMDICACDYDRAAEALKLSHGKVKNAILMELAEISYEESISRLKEFDGSIKSALRNSR
jgi:N-acetylmuramic acid 6-phosphate etherase